ncbi:hypothetical protein [Virgisporangium aliadipatigenens]|uniref:hypothetical protein n=1 Tax=Virgisporangium aliadipatigenens TaxID=741659 RepID=UPI001EF1F8BA|nr:hypothetical protein [Virgisporangium aliadipatigenens]
MDSPSELLQGAASRRTLLVAGALAPAAALTGAGPEPEAGGLRAISMATHIHGPFSEGKASFEAHLAQARKNKVDVVWWTDHDFRVAAHDHRQAVHFTGAGEPDGIMAFGWTKKLDGKMAGDRVEFVDEPRSPYDQKPALRLSADGGPGTLWYAAKAWNDTYNACIADTTLSIDVRPEEKGGTLLLQVDLSHHPARKGRSAGVYVLRYRIGGTGSPKYKADGITGYVDLPAAPGQWSTITLWLTQDVQKLWPDLVAGDNALRNLKLGVTAKEKEKVSYVVDRLLFVRSRRRGQAGEDLRAEVLAAYAREYADVVQYRAYEVSLVRHLNWYGGDQTMPAFTSPPVRDNDPGRTAAMVDFLHGHGGLVCWNHPLDVEKKESLATLMRERRMLGTDLVEIGRKEWAELLWAFDVAARHALFCTAIGGSDDHDGVDWTAADEPYLTYVWAASTTRADLLAALKKGAAWWVNAAKYRGSLDLRVGGKPAMGAAIVSSAAVQVECSATSLPSGAKLEIVTGRADRDGDSPSVSTAVASAGKKTVTVRPDTYVRTQVRLADRVVAASNPVWVLTQAPPTGIPADRRRTP